MKHKLLILLVLVNTFLFVTEAFMEEIGVLEGNIDLFDSEGRKGNYFYETYESFQENILESYPWVRTVFIYGGSALTAYQFAITVYKNFKPIMDCCRSRANRAREHVEGMRHQLEIVGLNSQLRALMVKLVDLTKENLRLEGIVGQYEKTICHLQSVQLARDSTIRTQVEQLGLKSLSLERSNNNIIKLTRELSIQRSDTSRLDQLYKSLQVNSDGQKIRLAELKQQHKALQLHSREQEKDLLQRKQLHQSLQLSFKEQEEKLTKQRQEHETLQLYSRVQKARLAKKEQSAQELEKVIRDLRDRISEEFTEVVAH